MPTYEFRCRSCGTTFTENRPMAESGQPAACPAGHGDTVRLLTVSGALKGAPDTGAPRSGQGCCGGGCCG